jgi:anti-anti-sigma factor
MAIVRVDGSPTVPHELLTVEVIPGEPTVLVLDGEVDLSTINVLRSAIGSAAGRDVVVDCSSLSFLDSLGIGAFAQLYADAQTNGTDVVLHNLNGGPRRSLEISGLLDLFDKPRPT